MGKTPARREKAAQPLLPPNPKTQKKKSAQSVVNKKREIKYTSSLVFGGDLAAFGIVSGFGDWCAAQHNSGDWNAARVVPVSRVGIATSHFVGHD